MSDIELFNGDYCCVNGMQFCCTDREQIVRDFPDWSPQFHLVLAHEVTNESPYGRLLREWLEDPRGVGMCVHKTQRETNILLSLPAATSMLLPGLRHCYLGRSGAEIEEVLEWNKIKFRPGLCQITLRPIRDTRRPVREQD